MSLVFFLVRRALAKAFGGTNPMQQQGQQQRGHQPHANPRQPRQTANNSDVVETIWAGMSATQLRTSFGMPQSKQNIQGGEIWVYANLNGQGTETEITIENGIVSGWKDTVSPPPTLSQGERG